MHELPIVTGISPIQGPPGTKVTIRGENLGHGPKDLIDLHICDCDCLLSAEWQSPNKIIARSGASFKTGDILVTTRSGGRGTCTVQFTGIEETTGPLKESAVWVSDVSMTISRNWHRPLLPSSLHQDDPLGLSSEADDSLSHTQLQELCPDGVSDVGQSEFSVSRFLLENHYATSFEDLKSGTKFLKRRVNSEKEGQIIFLKGNLGAIFDQLQTEVTLKNVISKKGLPSTKSLEKQITDVKVEANTLFDKVLDREKRAEEIRNALKVVNKYKFLFDLPVMIEKNMKKGNYDSVVNDYSRAKMFFGLTKISALKKVIDGVDVKMMDIRRQLMDKLKRFPSSMDEQKGLIRHLVNLEYPGDVAWEFLVSYFDYITKVMYKCMEEHLLKAKGDNDKGQNHLKPVDKEYKRETAPRLVFLEELTDILSATFPDFWRLGQSYFKGELTPKIDSSKQASFKQKVLDIVVIYNQLVRAALLPTTLDSGSDHRKKFGFWPDFSKPPAFTDTAAWLSECLQSLRSCRSFLEVLDLPKDVIKFAENLVLDFRKLTLRLLFESAVEEIRGLKGKETWVVTYRDSLGGITDLPSQFEKIARSALTTVTELSIRGDEGETSLIANSGANDLKSCCKRTFIEFSNLLKSFYKKDSDPRSRRVSHEQRILIARSNCQYTKVIVLPKLQQLCLKLELTNVNLNEVTDEYEKVCQVLYECYVNNICDQDHDDSLVNLIEPHMYPGNFKWSHCDVIPKDVSPYAHEIVLNVVKVVKDTGSLCEPIIDDVLRRVVEVVANELHRLFSTDSKFSRYGTIQARADIMLLKEMLRPYLTDKSRGFFEEAMNVVPHVTEQSDNEYPEILHRQVEIVIKSILAVPFDSPRSLLARRHLTSVESENGVKKSCESSELLVSINPEFDPEQIAIQMFSTLSW